MNLTLHVFRKDVRQQRAWLAVWGGLLLLDLTVNVGWAGQPVFSSRHGFEGSYTTWAAALPGVLWTLFVLLSGMAVLADSPAARDGFLATRPVALGERLGAKLGFNFLLVILPWMLVEALHLKLSGQPGWLVLQGTWERARMAVPISLGIGAFTAFWPNGGRLVTGLLGLGACYLGVNLLLACLREWAGLETPTGRNMNQLFCACVMVAGLMVAAWWHSRAHRGTRRRWAVLLVVVILLPYLATWIPVKQLQLQPEGQPAVERLLNNHAFNVPMRRFSLIDETNPDADQHRFQVNMYPELSGLPTNMLVTWSATNAILARVGGADLQNSKVRAHQPVFGWNSQLGGRCLAADVFATWSKEFPDDFVVSQDNYYGASDNNCFLGRFLMPPDRATREVPLTVRADLQARVMRWAKIADLPLTPGATSQDEFGEFVYCGTRFPSKPELQDMSFCILRRQVALDTMTDSRGSSMARGPLSHMVFAVYDTQQHRLLMPGDVSDSAVRGAHTARAQHYLSLTYPEFATQIKDVPESLSHLDLKRFRLVVFEQTWVGSVSAAWQSAPFTIAEQLQRIMQTLQPGASSLSSADMAQRLAALPVPPPNASRQEVGRYLTGVLELIGSQQRYISADSPEVNLIVPFVRGQLPMLLDGLPVLEGNASRLVLEAIRLGAGEEQKSQLIAGMQRVPLLAGILSARGWADEPEARAAIYALTNYPHSLPMEAMQVMASYRDPKLYPRLLEEFTASPGPWLDDLLHVLGLDAETDAIAARAWHRDRLVEPANWTAYSRTTSFRTALQHGNPEALADALRYARNLTPEERRQNVTTSLGVTVRDAFHRPGAEGSGREDHEATVNWLARHRAEDFVFNPARRQFELRPSLAQNP